MIAPGITGVILSGGESKRLGGISKSHLIVEGKKIISREIQILEDLFDEIIIVTNSPEKFKDITSCKIVGDLFHKVGPLGGLHAALKSSLNEAVFVFAGDMPFLNKPLITDQISKFSTEKCEAFVPKIGDKIEPLHAIYSKKILDRLEKRLLINKQYAVWDFLKELDVKYMRYDDTEEIRRSFVNINSQNDLDKIYGL